MNLVWEPLRSLAAKMLRWHSLLFGALVATLAFGERAAWGQPQSGMVQPDQLTFGTVPVGATVEGSVRLFVGAGDTKGLRVEVSPPPFVRIRNTRLGTQTYDNLGTFVVCDVAISVDTEQAESLHGELEIRVGDLTITVPLSAEVKAADPKATRVLVLGSPFNRVSTSQSDDFKPWLRVVESANLAPQYLEVDEGDSVLRNRNLGEFDVILLPGEALARIRDDDFDQLDAFLEAGGRVVVATAHFMLGTVEKANRLLASYGLEILDTEPRINGHLLIHRLGLGDDPFNEGIRQLSFSRPSPIAVDNRKNARALASDDNDPKEVYVATSPAGKGEVIAISASIWWNWMAEIPETDTDNALYFGRLLTKQRSTTDQSRVPDR